MKETVTTAAGIKVPTEKVLETIGRRLLVNGFPFVVDLENSRGCRLVDESTGKRYLDFFMFYASTPIGFNHPRLLEEEFKERLLKATINKPSNTDFYTRYMAEFVQAADRYAIPDYLPHMFLISGGALAVENALKAAFDYKVRKNFAKGAKKEIGTQVIHFREAFHGRSGYTLSLTNTDPVKTMYFTKFKWPRITNPKITFPIEKHLESVIATEKKAESEIKAAIKKHGDDIAALIIEPVQGEGGDNQFRPEFLRFLREITEENDIIFAVDEIQTGVGITGRFWAHEHASVQPDILAFGKKMQVCGVLASKKLGDDEGVFKRPSRINSTWGGDLGDMVRATRYLEVIHEENLVENARSVGEHLVNSLVKLSGRFPDSITNARGLGLMAAFDVPADKRKAFLAEVRKNGLIIVGCGRHSVRFRPPLNVTGAEVDEAMDILNRSAKGIFG
jgi:L-lysine 6-transaminase